MLAPRLAAGLLLVAVLSACAGEEPAQPRALPSPPSPAASPSPSPAASKTPADDRAAVEAAVRAYYDGVNEAVSTGRTEAFLAATTAGCNCRGYLPRLEELLSEGRLEGNQFAVQSLTVDDVEPVVALVTAVVDTSPGKVVAGDGRVVRSLDGQSDVENELVLRKGAKGWLVDTLTVSS